MTIIKQMIDCLSTSQLLDPQKVEQEYQKQEKISLKLQVLQQSVFKSYTIKKSKSVRHHYSHPHKTNKEQEAKADFVSFLTTKPSKKAASVTNITFGKQQSNPSLGRTLSLFTPKVALPATCRRNISKQEEIIDKIILIQKNNLQKQLSERPRLVQLRDSQTLLKKNSLFLVNCLKTRYRDDRKNIHIGNVANAANHIGFKQKGLTNTLYQQRFQYMEEAKQRITQAKIEKKKEIKLARLTPLLPEPWSSDYPEL